MFQCMFVWNINTHTHKITCFFVFAIVYALHYGHHDECGSHFTDHIIFTAVRGWDLVCVCSCTCCCLHDCVEKNVLMLYLWSLGQCWILLFEFLQIRTHVYIKCLLKYVTEKISDADLFSTQKVIHFIQAYHFISMSHPKLFTMQQSTENCNFGKTNSSMHIIYSLLLHSGYKYIYTTTVKFAWAAFCTMHFAPCLWICVQVPLCVRAEGFPPISAVPRELLSGRPHRGTVALCSQPSLGSAAFSSELGLKQVLRFLFATHDSSTSWFFNLMIYSSDELVHL